MCKPHKDERGPTYGGAAEKPSVRRRLGDPASFEEPGRERVYYPNLGPPSRCVCLSAHISAACPCVLCHGVEARPGMGLTP